MASDFIPCPSCQRATKHVRWTGERVRCQTCGMERLVRQAPRGGAKPEPKRRPIQDPIK